MLNSFYVSTKGNPDIFSIVKKTKDAVKKSLKRLDLYKMYFSHIWCLLKMEDYELAMK